MSRVRGHRSPYSSSLIPHSSFIHFSLWFIRFFNVFAFFFYESLFTLHSLLTISHRIDICGAFNGSFFIRAVNRSFSCAFTENVAIFVYFRLINKFQDVGRRLDRVVVIHLYGVWTIREDTGWLSIIINSFLNPNHHCLRQCFTSLIQSMKLIQKNLNSTYFERSSIKLSIFLLLNVKPALSHSSIPNLKQWSDIHCQWTT